MTSWFLIYRSRVFVMGIEFFWNLEIFGKSMKEIDMVIIEFSRKRGHLILRYAMGIVFIWFGILKPFGLSPATELVKKTTLTLFPFVDASLMIAFLGWYEVTIGLFLIIQKLNRVGIFLLALQMPATMLPLVLFPELTFTQFPIALTLEGQYIIKNLVLMASAIVIAAHVQDR